MIQYWKSKKKNKEMRYKIIKIKFLKYKKKIII